MDLGGVDGLLHVSEMSWTRVQNPADVVQPGQTVKVIVLRVDRQRACPRTPNPPRPPRILSDLCVKKNGDAVRDLVMGARRRAGRRR